MLSQYRNDLFFLKSFALHFGTPQSYFIGKSHLNHGLVFGDKVNSTVDLPEGMPRDIFRALKKVWVCHRQMNITHETGETTPRTNRRPKTKTEKRAKPKSNKTNNKGAQKGKTRKRKGS
jgi:hypothetical protein